MIIFNIPFEQSPQGNWPVEKSTDGVHEFPNRLSAIAYAITQARSEEKAGHTVMVSLEGADGVWRNFDPDIKPPQ